MPGPFAQLAQTYRDSGFNPVPIRPGTKAPDPSHWQKERQDDHTFEQWLGRYQEAFGIGIVLGTPLDAILSGPEMHGQRLVAVDVDQDDLVEPVFHALRIRPERACAKVGKKGITFFVRAAADVVNRKIKRRTEKKPMLEILAAGSQTIIPPTIHMDTGAPYEWRGQPLLTARMRDLPELTDNVMDELEALCEGGAAAEHFNALRTMVWAGVGGGGDTHDTCVAAVASLVARGWRDTEIHSRIEFAKEAACLREGQEYDWPASTRAITEWIDSARRKGMAEPGTDKVAPERRAAEWLIQHLGGPDLCKSLGKGLLRYQDGSWHELSMGLPTEQMILSQFKGLNDAKARAAVSIAVTLCWSPTFGHQEHARYMVCHGGGTLDARTGATERWDAAHELIFKARATYDPEADCPLYDGLIRGLLGDDQARVDALEEYLGWTFAQDTSFEKVLFLVGKSGIGKTTLVNVLERIHAPGAASHTAIHDIGEATARVNLVGKLINVSSEKSRVRSISDDTLKKIVSGEAVEVRPLFHNAFSARLFVRFINTVNDMPDMSDYSDGLARRLLVLSCGDARPPAHPDPRFIDRLMGERDGIFTRWMRALQRLVQRRSFFIPESVARDVAEYITSSSMVRMWLEERTVPGPTTVNDVLYRDYAMWAESRIGGERWKYLSIINWGKEMSALGHKSTKERIGWVRKIGLKSTRHSQGPDQGF